MKVSNWSDVAPLREALASLAGTADAPVDAKRIFDALHGDLGVEERRAVVDELVLNANAAEAWRLACELAPPPAAAISRKPGAWRWLSIAAAVLLAASLGWQFVKPFSVSNEPPYRGVAERAIASSLPLDAVLPRAQPVLRWSPVEGARYRVRVLTPDLEVLEEIDGLRSAEHSVGPDVLRQLPPGGRILWQVQARVPGDAVIESATFSVQVE